MTGESIGTARLDIVVDTSQFDTAITAAKRSVSGMSQAAQEEYNKLNGAEKRRIDSLIKQADTLGFTRQQQILYNAALKGTPTNVLDELKKKLSGTGDAAAKAGIQFNQYGLSQKQTIAAMRQVPAQITDIFTSLQGGQKPLTVLLQQGGQLKDVFGGIRPAAAALGTQLLSMVNPLTVTAALVGGLAVAWKNATDRQHEFQVSLATTGNYAGTSVTRLNELVDELDQLNGVTRGGAVEALNAVVNSGRVATQQFEQVAATAARIEAATGQSVDKTVAKFVEISRGPVDAILKLNESEHFLTRTQFERIAVLQDEGREQEAVAEATRIYSEHLDDVASRASASLPAISRWWRDIKDETSHAWGEVETYMTLLDRAIKKQGELKAGAPQQMSASGALANQSLLGLVPQSVRGNVGTLFNMTAKEWLRQKGGADFSGVSATVGETFVSAEAIEARKLLEEFNRRELNYLDAAAKKKREIAEIDDLLTKKIITQEQHRTRIAQIEASYAEKAKKAAGSKATPTDPAVSIIARIKQQIALNEAQLKSEDKLTASDRLQVQVKLELERIGGKLTGSKKALIEAMLAELDASGDLAVKHQQEVKAKADLARLTDQLAVSEENRRRANAADLVGIGRGDVAIEMLRRQIDIQRELEDGLDRILRDAGEKSDQALDDERAALQASIQRKLDDERGYWEAREAMQSNWVNGAKRAYENWIASTKDAAGQAEQIFSEAFGTLEDIGVDALSGNLKSWGDYFENLHQMILRFIVKQQLTKWMESLKTSSESGGSGGWFSTLLGAFFSGAGSSGGNSASSAAQASGDFGMFNPNMPGFAKGGVFTNQVVTQPTQFRFAKGIGLMGEAGPEAIMPLKRGRDGKLGVAAEAMPSGGGDTYNNTTFVLPTRYTPQTQAQIDQHNQRVQQRTSQRNG